MTKQWLMRRAVRMPVSRDTTAPISSSVCRLPFIRASARPARTSSTALAAESWLCSASTSSKPAMSSPALGGHLADARRRSDQDRLDQAQPRGFDRAFQRNLVAGMGDRRRDRRMLAGALDQPLVLLVPRRGRWRRQARSASPSPARRPCAPNSSSIRCQPAAAFVGQRRRCAARTSMHDLPAAGPRARVIVGQQAAEWRAPPAPRRAAAAGTARGTSSLSSRQAAAALGRLQAADRPAARRSRARRPCAPAGGHG